jgi:hypothetical protein
MVSRPFSGREKSQYFRASYDVLPRGITNQALGLALLYNPAVRGKASSEDAC